MSNKEFSTHELFFERVGGDYLHPTCYGESIWHVTVEEMYQHFKKRLITELAVSSPELLQHAEIFDKVISEP